MDRSVTVRYFKLESVGARPVTFEDAVEAAHRLGASPRDRERVVSAGVTIRLERRRRVRGLLTGEVVRVQTENIPPEAQHHGLIPLGIGGLGHSVAFVYDPTSQVIAIQFDPRGVSLGRLLDYLAAVRVGTRLRFEAVVNEDAWDRYNRGNPRKLSLTIAAPQDLERIQGEGNSVIEASKRLAEIANAPVITIEVSMGQARRGSLAKRFVDSVLRGLTEGDNAENARSLSVTTKQEGLPSDTIDFIRDFSRDQDTLNLPSDDHDENISTRLRFIEGRLNERLPVLRDMYGAG